MRREAVALLVALFGLAACASDEDGLRQFRAGDYDASFKTFTARADNGDGAAINFIGIHYYLGLGVDRDFGAAAQWFERAARASNADAQRNLGVLYLRGWGVRRDNVKAYGWLFQASRQGNRGAREYLKTVNHLITPNQNILARQWIADQLQQPSEPDHGAPANGPQL